MTVSFAVPADPQVLSTFDSRWDPVQPILGPPPGQRRLGERARVSIPAAVWRRGVVTHARVVELSTTGVAVAGSPRFEPGKEVTLYLKRSGAMKVAVRLTARSVRVTNLGHQAFELIHLGAAERLTLAEIIDREARPSAGVSSEADAPVFTLRRITASR